MGLNVCIIAYISSYFGTFFVCIFRGFFVHIIRSLLIRIMFSDEFNPIATNLLKHLQTELDFLMKVIAKRSDDYFGSYRVCRNLL